MGLKFVKILAVRTPGDQLPELLMAFGTPAVGIFAPDVCVVAESQYDQYVTYAESEVAKGGEPNVSIDQLDVGMGHLVATKLNILDEHIKLDDLDYIDAPPMSFPAELLENPVLEKKLAPLSPLAEHNFYDTKFNELSRKAIGMNPASEPGRIFKAEIADLQRKICQISYCSAGPN